LEALYAASSGAETRPPTLDTFTMTPEPRCRQPGKTAWIMRKAPSVFVSNHLPDTIEWIAFHRPLSKDAGVVDDCIERTNLFKAPRHGVIAGDIERMCLDAFQTTQCGYVGGDDAMPSVGKYLRRCHSYAACRACNQNQRNSSRP